MKIDELTKEISRREDRLKAIPRDLEKLTVKLNGLRARRMELMGSVGLGEPGALEEVEVIETKLKDLLREQARLNEIAVELNHSIQDLDAELYGLLCAEELKELPKLRDAINGGLKVMAKAIAEIDFGGLSLENSARHFAGIAQQIEPELRKATTSAITSRVAGLCADPTRPSVVDLLEVEKLLRQGVEFAEQRQEQIANNLASTRQSLALTRRQLEGQTAF